MQRIVIKDISFKTGTNDKGEWKLTNITGADGAKFGSFDHHAAELKAGDVIEAEIEIKGKNNNVKSFKVLEHTAAPAASSPAPASPQPSGDTKRGMTPEAWAEKDRTERASIEAQTAFKGIMEIIANLKSNETITVGSKLDLAYSRALDWAIEKLNMNAKPITIMSKPAPVKHDGDNDWDKMGKDRDILQDAPQPKSTAVATPEGQIDMEWVKETQAAIRWTDKTARTWMASNFKMKDTGDLQEMINMTTPENRHVFCKKLRDMLEAAGKGG